MAYAITLVRAVSKVLQFARQGTTSALDGAGIAGGSVQADAQRVIFDVLYEFAAAGHPGFLHRAKPFTADSNGVVTISGSLIIGVRGAGKHDGVKFRILNNEVFYGNTSQFFRANENVILDTFELPDVADTAPCFEKLDAETQHEIVAEATRRYAFIVRGDPAADAVASRQIGEFQAAKEVGRTRLEPNFSGRPFGSGIGEGGRGARGGEA